jgi:drug/metabolite transporter (DMT)-like permease
MGGMWVLLALSASLFWGLSYVFNEEIYKHMSVFTALSIMSFVIFIATAFMAYVTDNLKPDLVALATSKRLVWYLVGGIMALLIAELFIGFSITAKNATLAGLIEISYPIFIALFSFILFRSVVNLPTMLGGMIIFVGVFVIYYFNN